MAGIEKIVSGGQTGADRAALDFAIAQGILHGGWCPRDRMAEDGPIDVCYQLQETPRFLNRVQSRCNPHVVTNTITMLVSISAAPDGRVQSSGSVVTKMIDFGITPPAPSVGGLSIKTGDEVKLRFSVVVDCRTVLMHNPAVNSSLSRRDFLRNCALSGSAFLFLKHSSSIYSAQANDKLNIALVGVGGRGEWFTTTIPRMGHNLVALCDVDENKNPDAYERMPQAKRYKDFRKMLDEMSGSIDAVIVATPDHTHAVVTAAAIKAGKPVFTEKPLTRTLHESRALRELARKHKVATSMGNQGTAAGPFRRALELVQRGALGEIQAVHIWNDSGGADRKQPPAQGGPTPEYLDWDLWLGPAAARPYNREWMNRHLWREFGTSQLGNWASHTANLAFMAMHVQDLWLKPEAGRSPLRITARQSGVNKLSFPKWEVVKYDIPARGKLPPITFTWHNGRAPESRELLESLVGEGLDWGDKKDKKWVDFAGAVIVGKNASIHTTGHNASFRLLPKEKFAEIQTERPETIEASHGHEQDWFTACRGGPAAWANFDYADALNEFLMLGNVSTQFESTLEFDPVAMKISNSAEADALLRCEYRQGWTL